MRTADQVITYEEVKAEFLKGMENPNSTKIIELRSLFSVMRSTDGKEFHGATKEQMIGWVLNGFTAPEFDLTAAYTPRSIKRRLRWDEEGDLNITAALSGDETPYQRWDQRVAKPGIKVVAQFGGLAVMKTETLAEYGAWIAGLIDGLYTQGFDPEVSLFHSAEGMLVGSYREFSYEMILKEKDQKVDFSEYAAMFSPGGVRMLGFTAKGVSVTKAGKKFDGVGGTTFKGWSVEWDEDERTLFIGMDGGGSRFPAEKMSNELKETGLFNG